MILHVRRSSLDFALDLAWMGRIWTGESRYSSPGDISLWYERRWIGL